MENRNKTREIIIEISRRRIPFKRTRYQAFCLKCGEIAELLNFSPAAEYCQTTLYDIYRRAENGEFHLIHNSKGEVRICRNSLQKQLINSSEAKKSGDFTIHTIQ